VQPAERKDVSAETRCGYKQRQERKEKAISSEQLLLLDARKKMSCLVAAQHQDLGDGECAITPSSGG